jgi:hypothetical protein
MKLQILVLGGLLCLGATAPAQTSSQSTKSTQSANRMKRPAAAATAGQVTGCVDQQGGHYVLRDVQTDQLIQLQAASADADNDFARFVGHQAQASGTMSSGVLTVAHIGQVADMCPIGK